VVVIVAGHINPNSEAGLSVAATPRRRSFRPVASEFGINYDKDFMSSGFLAAEADGVGCDRLSNNRSKRSGGGVRSRRMSWAKPVFRLTASSRLAESLARCPLNPFTV